MKKVFLIISQNSQEETCAGVSFLIKLQAMAKLAQTIRRQSVRTATFRFSCKATL